MRAVIYARYSSENQREASIADQLEVCRRLIAREGWQLAGNYSDQAISGASRFRPGLQRLRADAEARAFDVIVCEALDRVGRKLADVAELHDLLSYLGIKLVTVATGEVTALHIGMLGTLAQLALSDLREKTKRGQLGRALQGRIPGGHAYGYDVVENHGKGARGERVINPAEADIVRRIFVAFADGESPRAIARRLNAEGVPGPDGRAWRDTTIRGQVDRGTGLLNNAIYAGRLEWNRCSYVKDPRTGKRVARVNAKEQWEIVAVPELRIVPDDLWQQVKQRQAMVRIEIGRDANGNALNRAHRRRFLFSGLLVCGLCGGGYTIVGKDRYGCAAHKNQGTCANTRTILRPEIEERVLAGLKQRLLAPELVREFTDEVERALEARSRDAERQRRTLDREAVAVNRKIAAMLKAIEDGLYNSSMKERMATLEAEKIAIQARLDQLGAPPPVRLHPNLSAVYEEKVARLAEALNVPETRAEAGEIIRSLIERIVLTPEGERLKAELYGDLAGILALCEGARQGAGGGSEVSVVAGGGFEPPTFRL